MRDDELKRLIRRDMEKELAFLNDRPSLRGQIMQRMKGARVVKRRISLSLAVVLALLLSTAAALAAGGWNVLDFLGLTDEK